MSFGSCDQPAQGVDVLDDVGLPLDFLGRGPEGKQALYPAGDHGSSRPVMGKLPNAKASASAKNRDTLSYTFHSHGLNQTQSMKRYAPQSQKKNRMASEHRPKIIELLMPRLSATVPWRRLFPSARAKRDQWGLVGRVMHHPCGRAASPWP